MASIFEAYKKFWKGYVDFRGKTNKKDFWLAMLVQAVIILLFVALREGTGSNIFYTLYTVFALASFLPMVAITARRFRDAGKSMLNFLWWLLPVAGQIVMIVRLCAPSAVETTKKSAVETEKKSSVEIREAPVYKLREIYDEETRKEIHSKLDNMARIYHNFFPGSPYETELTQQAALLANPETAQTKDDWYKTAGTLEMAAMNKLAENQQDLLIDRGAKKIRDFFADK